LSCLEEPAWEGFEMGDAMAGFCLSSESSDCAIRGISYSKRLITNDYRKGGKQKRKRKKKKKGKKSQCKIFTINFYKFNNFDGFYGYLNYINYFLFFFMKTNFFSCFYFF
jgi:hypothetical protein